MCSTLLLANFLTTAICCVSGKFITTALTQAHKRFKRTRIYYDTDTQYANFRGNPLCHATRRHFTVKNDEKWERNLSFWGGWAVVCLSSAWKIPTTTAVVQKRNKVLGFNQWPYYALSNRAPHLCKHVHGHWPWGPIWLTRILCCLRGFHVSGDKKRRNILA